MGIPMLKIRRSHDRLIFNMGIPILLRYLYIEMAPRFIHLKFLSSIIDFFIRYKAFLIIHDYVKKKVQPIEIFVFIFCV